MRAKLVRNPVIPMATNPQKVQRRSIGRNVQRHTAQLPAQSDTGRAATPRYPTRSTLATPDSAVMRKGGSMGANEPMIDFGERLFIRCELPNPRAGIVGGGEQPPRIVVIGSVQHGLMEPIVFRGDASVRLVDRANTV